MSLFSRINLCILCCTVFIACENKKQIRYSKTVVFDENYYSGVRCAGVTGNGNGELIYFANAESKKAVFFYNKQGNKVDSISLKNVLKDDYIQAIAAEGPDTIILLSAYTNNLYVINQEGEITRKVQLLSATPANAKYELQASFTSGHFYKKKRAILNLAVKFPEDPSLQNAFELFTQERAKSEYFSMVSNIFTDTMLHNQGVGGFYNRFIPPGHLNIEPPMYTLCNDDILLYSMYTDSLYVIDTGLHLKKAVQIKSAYSRIGCTPPATGNGKADSLNVLAQTSGMILNITHDAYRKYVLLSIRHRVPGNSGRKKMAEFSPWSVMILDENYNYIDEIPFEQGKYAPGEILPVREGILIYRNSDTMHGKAQFDFMNTYSRLMACLCIFLLCCNTAADKNDLLHELGKMGVTIDNETRGIFLISDKSCPACNIKFMNAINPKLGDRRYIFVVSSDGITNDIGPYTNGSRQNVFLDKNKLIYYNDSIQASVFIALSNRHVDTVIELDPAKVDAQVAYFEAKIKD